jgi:hypothetical protein
MPIPNKIDQKILNATNDKFSPNPASVREKLSKLGWTKKNSGDFSSVYENPSKSYVIKINNRQDPGFAGFVQLTKKYPNIHFPQITSSKMFSYKNKKLYVYLIEKLYHIQMTPKNERIVELIDDIASYVRLSINKREWLENTLLGMSVEKWLTKTRNLQIFRNDPSLFDAAYTIGMYGKGALDLKSSNIMQRKDGTIVIVDPLVKNKFD